ncbi:MAG TPA: uroporphyrinogen decarboxylase family protein [Solirubrobacteraceae bacterium]|nr:uroporphyrinogen decarboxylase family protein [Solirubrobacteraceae bacterium]
MKPRERVAAALEHEQPDRAPFQASFAPEAAARLRAELGLPVAPAPNPYGSGNPHDLEIALREDVLLTSVGWSNSYHQRPSDELDEWGVGWRLVPYTTPYGEGHYPDVISHPLADAASLAGYRAPDPDREQLYAHATHTLFSYQDDYWIAGVTIATIFDTAWALRGLEQLLIDFVVDPDLADAILEIPYRYHRAAAQRLTRMGVDMIVIGDDIAHRGGLLISPVHWRRFLKPRLAELISALRALNAQLKIAYHSDGNVQALVPELIEIGVDVLHPAQPSAMDLETCKRRYGRSLSLWGTLDDEQTLPFGSEAEVRREVRRRIRGLGRGGGLIVGPTHQLGIDIPPGNVWAMVEEATGVVTRGVID